MNSSTLARALLLIATGLAAAACGSPLDGNYEEKRAGTSTTTATEPNVADATAVTTPAAPAAVAEPCPGVALHGDHTSCDADDRQAADEQQAARDAITPAPGTGSDVVAPTPTPAPAPDVVVPTQDPNIVEFHIKAGTGKSPWNTAAETVIVKVGQTLRLINDDSVTHRLHTGGSPCPHGDNFAPGKTYDCVVTKTIDPAKTPGATYDHIAGPKATFFLKAVP